MKHSPLDKPNLTVLASQMVPRKDGSIHAEGIAATKDAVMEEKYKDSTVPISERVADLLSYDTG